MLSALRQKKNSPVIVVLLGMIVFLMIGFGVSINDSANGTWAAKVNGQEISEQEFANRYSLAYRSRQGENRGYDRARAEQEKLRENVLNGMITTKLLAAEAERQGMAVDAEALKKAILANESFHVDGRFDKKQYERALTGFFQTTKERYEAEQREQMLADTFIGAIRGASVSESEVKEAFEADRRSVNVSFVQIPKKAFDGAVGTVTPADAKAWAAGQADAEEQVKKYYARWKSQRYDISEQVCFQHILARFEANIPEQKKEAQEKVKKALEAVKAGQDFLKVAAQYSDDKNAEQGCATESQLEPRLAQAVFGLKVGEVSAPIEAAFGYELVKLIDKKEPIRRTLEEVKDEIELELAKEARAADLAKKRAEELLAAAKAQNDLAAAVALAATTEPKLELKVDETGPFNRTREFLPKLGLAKDVSRAAWTLTPEAPFASAPVATDTAWVLIQLKDKKEPSAAELEAARPSLIYSLTIRKQNAVFEAWQKHLREKAKVDINPAVLSYDTTGRPPVQPPM